MINSNVLNVSGLDATSLGRTATVVGNRRHILDGSDFDAKGLDGTNGGFTAGAGSLNADFSFAQAMAHRLAAGILADNLTSVSRALAGAFEAHLAGRGPADHITAFVSDADNGVIEGGGNVNDPSGNVLAALGLKDFDLVGRVAQSDFCENIAAGFRFLFFGGGSRCGSSSNIRFCGYNGSHGLFCSVIDDFFSHWRKTLVIK